ncbi:hypothetical protein [Micromonospora echinofusca]|uniref:DNA-binding protein n=1 Tax=Micromonospora echinofusca TaxID=47858 RepID=A0ABS3VPG8_MICEH|nr:hypothetical protein [Micromonospora echinofusca]MBO4206429.1 hypothetical protein [Micromonospora echinofusca]
MADQTRPWAERTVEVPPQPNGVGVPSQRGRAAVPPPPDAADPTRQEGFLRGVASVGARRAPRTEQFTAVGSDPADAHWGEQSRPRLPLSYHVAQLKLGGEWSAAGGLFAFVCWGVWAISARGDLTSPVMTFVLSLLVAVGLFGLARLLGRVVWERQLGRVRRTARGAHLVTAVFLVGLGLAYLRQTEWVVSAWNWVFG